MQLSKDILNLPHPGPRIDSGVLQFGVGWPGYYFTGQDALSTSDTLKVISLAMRANSVPEPACRYLDDLADRLQACDAAGSGPRGYNFDAR